MKSDDMRHQLAHLGNGAHALATQMLGSAEAAEDAVQDAFTSVLHRPDAFDASKGTLKSWFLTIVHNRCIDLIRRRRPEESDIADAGIADVLGIAKGTVMSRLHRARLALKEELTRHGK